METFKLRNGLEIPIELLEVKEFISTMKYTIYDLRNLAPFELSFIKKRCYEEKIKGFEEYLKIIKR